MAAAALLMLTGRRIGIFEIQTLLGAGGMGEVYRAHDTKLGRDVAIKILPRVFTADPERLARFDREARVLASLNHPHVGAIYGIEEAEGIQALVLELVEGHTLTDHLRRNHVTFAQALAIARQIADALDAAHEKGIVHRDLKPANIKVTPDGVVKVLDFGLAKAASGDEAALDLTHSPTWTAGGTRDGVILGTAAYMSPEQARGKPVDKRTDIWAFGCVLFEMLTGRVAFPGETVSDTIVAILEREPDWSVLPAEVSPAVRRLLQRCLDKSQKTRLRDIGEARHEIDEVLSPLASRGDTRVRDAHVVGQPSTPRGIRIGRWLAAAAVLAFIATAIAWRLQRSDFFWRNPIEGAKFTILTDVEGAKQNASISRDGKFFAFLSDRDGPWDAWVGQIGTGDVHNLTNGKVPEIRNPAVRTLSFSPDGLLVTIWNRTLNATGRALVDGGWAVPTMGGGLRPYLPGIAELEWSSDGARIVYHPSAPGDAMFVTEPGEKTGHQIYTARSGVHNHFQIWSPNDAFIYFLHGFPLDEMDVWRIRPTGGEPERMTFHESRITFPVFVDNRTLAYLATDSDGSGPWIYAMDVEHRVPHRISTGVEEYTSLAASADGRRLVATSSRSTAGLWRVPIRDRPAGASDAKPVALPTPRSLSPRLASGFMVYRVSKAGTDGLWKLESGNAAQVWSGADGRAVEGAAIAPDGRRVAFVTQKRGVMRLNVMNADGTAVRRLSEELDVRGAPAWSPDGKWIAIAANRGGDAHLMKIPADGGAPVELTTEYSLDPIWSPDGRFIVYSGADVGTTFRVRAVTADGAQKPLPEMILSRGSRRIAFRGADAALVVLKGNISRKDFWEVDLQTGRERQLTDLGRAFAIGDFDVSPDGREIVFDSSKEASDIVLIDRQGR